MVSAEVEHENAVNKYPDVVVTGEVELDILLNILVASFTLEVAGVCQIEIDIELIGKAEVVVSAVIVVKRSVTKHGAQFFIIMGVDEILFIRVSVAGICNRAVGVNLRVIRECGNALVGGSNKREILVAENIIRRFIVVTGFIICKPIVVEHRDKLRLVVVLQLVFRCGFRAYGLCNLFEMHTDKIPYGSIVRTAASIFLHVCIGSRTVCRNVCPAHSYIGGRRPVFPGRVIPTIFLITVTGIMTVAVPEATEIHTRSGSAVIFCA